MIVVYELVACTIIIIIIMIIFGGSIPCYNLHEFFLITAEHEINLVSIKSLLTGFPHLVRTLVSLPDPN